MPLVTIEVSRAQLRYAASGWVLLPISSFSLTFKGGEIMIFMCHSRYQFGFPLMCVFLICREIDSRLMGMQKETQ